MDYAALKVRLGLAPTQLDTGFRASWAEYPPDLLNRKSSTAKPRAPVPPEDLSHLNPRNGAGATKRGWWSRLSPQRQADILARRRQTLEKKR